jgi:Uma2 family endonuclease
MSASNTEKEMVRKREDYFSAGVELVWIIDPAGRTASVYQSETAVQTFEASGTLTGGDVLPGLRLSLSELFAELDRHG